MDSFKLYIRKPKTVPCPACGRVVSRKAKACPGCGEPVHVGAVQAVGGALKYGLIAALLAPGLVGIVYAIGVTLGWYR